MGYFRYSSPMTQILIASMICFCCPGMFDVFSSISSYKEQSLKATLDGAIGMVVTFSIFSVFGASIFNICGRLILIPAVLSYALLIISYLSPNESFYIAASILFGAGSGLFWTVIAGIIISYPDEKGKGKAFSLFYMISNLGSIISAIIHMINMWNPGNKIPIKNTTNFIFMVIIAASSFITIFLLPPNKVKRTNGSTASLHTHSDWVRECIELLRLFKNWQLIILIPFFFSTSWLHSYIINSYAYNYVMELRARSVNDLLYVLFQTIGGIFIGFLLDAKVLGFRRRRGFIVITFILIFAIALWIGVICTRESMLNNISLPGGIDVSDKGYPGYAILYGCFGLLYSIQEGLIYWLLGTMTNDTEHAVRYVAFYKIFQIAAESIYSSAVAYQVRTKIEIAIAFALTIVGLAFSYAFSFKITDTNVEHVDNLINSEQDIVIASGQVQEAINSEEINNVKNEA